jgi:hypothetical protein
MKLITRGDVDGIMCAVLLKAAGVVDTVQQAHPKDVQDGLVPAGPDDIVCNLPYIEGCGLWFDHHSSEDSAVRMPAAFKGRYEIAPSAARLVYEYLLPDHPELSRFEALLAIVDRFDSAQLTVDDVKRPMAGMLLAFVADPRTGLGLHHHFKISNKQMTDSLPGLLIEHSPAEILAMPDFKERVEAYEKDQEAAIEFFRKTSRVEGNVLVTDLRQAGSPPPANRFLIYTLEGFEGTNVSIRVSAAKGGDKVSIQAGHNIFNRTCKTSIGDLMAGHGGGGHRGAGTCQVPAADAERVLAEVIGKLKE